MDFSHYLVTETQEDNLPTKTVWTFWHDPHHTCRAWVNKKQSEMFGGMVVINSNLVIRSETKGEMLEFLVLITGCVLQRQWARAQH